MDRKMFTTRIESELIRRLKYLSADTERNLNDLLEEAIRILLKKYKKTKKE